VKERLQRYNTHAVQYDEGLAVARRIRASRYLGASLHFFLVALGADDMLSECSSKHNRGVNEVFYEAARVSLGTRPKGSGDGCIVM
jgi:Rho family protein